MQWIQNEKENIDTVIKTAQMMDQNVDVEATHNRFWEQMKQTCPLFNKLVFAAKITPAPVKGKA